MVNARRPRYGRRAGERGAAVFIVVLVITMLTTIGVFAVRAATLSTVASGHERQMTQTRYLTEYALSLVLADLEAAGGLSKIDAAVRTSTLPPQCSVNTSFCFDYIPQTLENSTGEPLVAARGPADPDTPAVPGSLGHADIAWDFMVELSDRTELLESEGMDQTSAGAVYITKCTVVANARGLIWPDATDAKDQDIAAFASQEAVSAYITLPCSAR